MQSTRGNGSKRLHTSLTSDEARLAGLLAQGRTTAEIASELGVSEGRAQQLLSRLEQAVQERRA